MQATTELGLMIETRPRRRDARRRIFLRWKARAGVWTHRSATLKGDELPWMACAGGVSWRAVFNESERLIERGDVCFGATEAEACERLASRRGLSFPVVLRTLPELWHSLKPL